MVASFRPQGWRMRPRNRGYGMTMGVTAITSQAAGGALGGLLRDLDKLFVPPRPLPSPADRAQAVIDEIDWSLPTIVLWMPGTSERGVAEDVATVLDGKRRPRAVAVPYQATWRLADSVPDGEATLRAVLERVRARLRPGQKVVLLGQSQGAWIISSVLLEPKYARIVHRVGLVAHPSLAPAHGHDTTVPTARLGRKVREFNADSDVVTKDLGRSGPAALSVVDSFARLEVGRAFVGALGIAVRDPGVLQALIASQLFRLRGGINPHESGSLLEQAVDWVLGD